MKQGVFLGADPKVFEEFIAQKGEADENLNDYEEEKRGPEQPIPRRTEQNSSISNFRSARDKIAEE